MKKLLSVLLTLALLCALLTACGDDDFPKPPDPKPTEAPTESPSDEPEETLWIVTNVGFESQQLYGQEDLRQIIEYFGGLPSGIDINLEVLPMEGADLHSRLTRIRTEIMSGKGPDVFLMMHPLEPDRELLFQVPQKTMEKRVFLPLDELKDSAKHMEWDKLNPKMLAAGQGSEGQMLLPMYYSLDLASADRKPSKLPATWEDAVSGNDPDISQAYGSAFHFGGKFRSLAFAEVADYKNETMTITEEKLKQRMKEGCSMAFDRENQETLWRGDYTFRPGLDQDPEGPVYSLYNADGGLTAMIVSYLAVNINTTHKEDALALADIMMSREFLSLEAFWNPERDARKSEMDLFSDVRIWFDGTPVYDDFFDTADSIAYYWVMPANRISLLDQAIQEISYVYIPTSIDMELWTLFNDCKAAENEDEIDKLVSKCYSTMKMMLAES